MAIIREQCFGLFDYLSKLETPWQLYLIVEKNLRLYGVMSDNVVEQFMGFLRPERYECPTFFVQAVCVITTTYLVICVISYVFNM